VLRSILAALASSKDGARTSWDSRTSAVPRSLGNDNLCIASLAMPTMVDGGALAASPLPSRSDTDRPLTLCANRRIPWAAKWLGHSSDAPKVRRAQGGKAADSLKANEETRGCPPPARA